MAENVFLLSDSLTVGYNRTPLIHDICLAVRPGEIVTLIGPNGSGKSTILKSITRHLETLGGKVLVQGRALNEYSYRDLSRKMAVVLTERLRPELMTCRDIVAAGRYPYTGRLGLLDAEDEAKVTEALRTVHAEEYAERDFSSVSDGQKQRILLARAICQEPEIIVLDEPTSFLDIRHKLELLAILRRMCRERNIAVIMSLHEIDLAQKISDRVVCVKGDVIAHFGPPEEIFLEENIRELYGIDNGSYDPLFGSIELPAPQGEPEILVLCAGGSGTFPFRRLQKDGIPFAAAILCRNDTDYRPAKALAARVVEAEPFEPFSEEAVAEALELVKTCREVWLTDFPVGTMNAGIKRVTEAAEKAGKLRTV